MATSIHTLMEHRTIHDYEDPHSNELHLSHADKSIVYLFVVIVSLSYAIEFYSYPPHTQRYFLSKDCVSGLVQGPIPNAVMMGEPSK